MLLFSSASSTLVRSMSSKKELLRTNLYHREILTSRLSNDKKPVVILVTPQNQFMPNLFLLNLTNLLLLTILATIHLMLILLLSLNLYTFQSHYSGLYLISVHVSLSLLYPSAFFFLQSVISFFFISFLS
jgi:hypothetical protein